MLERFTIIADLYYKYRWRFMAATAGVFLLLTAFMFSGHSALVGVVAAFAGPAITISWGMVLMCFWFEPTRGVLFQGVLIKWIPNFGQRALRWYFAAFLAVWFLFGVVIWPIFALIGLVYV